MAEFKHFSESILDDKYLIIDKMCCLSMWVQICLFQFNK